MDRPPIGKVPDPWGWTVSWPADCIYIGQPDEPGGTKIETAPDLSSYGVRACRKFGGFVTPMDCHRKCPEEFPA